MKNVSVKICFVFVLVLGLLTGCGKQLDSFSGIPADISQEPPLSSQDDPLHVQVIAQTSVALALDKRGGIYPSATGNIVPSQSIIISDSVMPPIVNFAVTCNVKFNPETNVATDSGGSITINVFYNDVAQTGLNKVFLRARMINDAGLRGTVISTVVIPLQIKVAQAASYTSITTNNLNLVEWPKPYTSVISQTVVIKMRADFTQAIAQRYQGVFIIELAKDVI